MFCKTGVGKNFAIFTAKILCWSLFLIKFQDWRPKFLSKRRLQRRCFSVNIKRFLRTAFLLKTYSLYLYFYLSIAFCAVKIYISQNLGEVNKIFQNQQDAPKYQLTFYVSFEKIPSDCFYQSLFFIALDLRIFSWIPGFYCCQHTAVTKEIFIC